MKTKRKSLKRWSFTGLFFQAWFVCFFICFVQVTSTEHGKHSLGKITASKKEQKFISPSIQEPFCWENRTVRTTFWLHSTFGGNAFFFKNVFLSLKSLSGFLLREVVTLPLFLCHMDEKIHPYPQHLHLQNVLLLSICMYKDVT